ncbi:hypothetical protein NHX12_011813 [Muraenolepis orangiensis]|uniref:Endonuclease domain-containing 1 protein n=1 Tax=Muraenolepis orangiensis TaxID=630683 RepID=A0A9Q0I733_9TELE|nr:hypothetical protein NHX12_011813 [Muraenolepis orangiensis]
MLQDSKGALRLLLLACLVGLMAAEVGSFSPCLRFFHRDTPPTGIDGSGCTEPVCQRYHNQYRFASLYDRLHRTPLYSAYLLTPAAGKRPETVWKYEPQLASSSANPEMLCFPINDKIDQNVIQSQAVPLDYTNSGYTRGHLNPSSHHQDMGDRNATFTLTNIVPQREGLQHGALEVAGGRGGSQAPGVLSGARVRDHRGPALRLRAALDQQQGGGARVPVVGLLLPRLQASLPSGARPFFPTYAAVGRNDPQSGPEIVPVDPNARVWGYDVKRMPLADLEDVLEQRLAMPVTLFQGQCV